MNPSEEVIAPAAADDLRSYVIRERERGPFEERYAVRLDQIQARELLAHIGALAERLAESLVDSLPNLRHQPRPDIEMLVTWLLLTVPSAELTSERIAAVLPPDLRHRQMMERALTDGAKVLGLLEEIAELGFLEQPSKVGVAYSGAIVPLLEGELSAEMGDYLCLVDWGVRAGGAKRIPDAAALEIAEPDHLRSLAAAGLLTWSEGEVVLNNKVRPGLRLWEYTTNPVETLAELRREAESDRSTLGDGIHLDAPQTVKMPTCFSDGPIDVGVTKGE